MNEQDQELAKQAGFYLYDLMETHEIKTIETDSRDEWVTLQKLIDLIRADEREACAQVCEKAIASIWEYSPEDVKQTGTNVCNNLAAAIRARGNT